MGTKDQLREISELKARLREQVSKGKQPDPKLADRLNTLLEETGLSEELNADVD